MSVNSEPRRVYLGFMIDANRINARQADPDMNQIEKWREDEVIEVLMAEVAYDEASAGGNARRSQKVSEHIYSITLPDAEDKAEMGRIEAILFPGGAASQSEKNDVEIVFNAKKYMRRLITADGGSKRQPGGILGNRDALAAIGVTVMTGAEAVELVRQRIADRDDRARQESAMDGVPLPPWVGQD